MPYPYDLQISATLAGLANLYLWNIPYPDRWSYRPWSRVEVCGDGTGAGFGFPVVVWEWDDMGQAVVHRFLSRFDADTDVTVPQYIRSYKDTGGVLDAADFLTLMHRPVDGQGKSLHSRVRAARAAYSGVTIQFTRLEEQ